MNFQPLDDFIFVHATLSRPRARRVTRFRLGNDRGKTVTSVEIDYSPGNVETQPVRGTLIFRERR